MSEVFLGIKLSLLRLTYPNPLPWVLPSPKQDMEHKRSPGLRQIRNGLKGLWPIPYLALTLCWNVCVVVRILRR